MPDQATRILVVDGDELVRVTAKTILERRGYALELAEHGTEAITAMRRSACDLVILDLVLPEKEGLETLLQLKQEFPRAKVVTISDGARRGVDEFLRLAQSLGADAALKKPIQPKVLMDQVTQLLHAPAAPKARAR